MGEEIDVSEPKNPLKLPPMGEEIDVSNPKSLEFPPMGKVKDMSGSQKPVKAELPTPIDLSQNKPGKVVQLDDAAEKEVQFVKVEQADVLHLLTVDPMTIDIAAAEDVEERLRKEVQARLKKKKRNVNLTNRKDQTAKRSKKDATLDDAQMDDLPTQPDAQMADLLTQPDEPMKDVHTDSEEHQLHRQIRALKRHIAQAIEAQNIQSSVPPKRLEAPPPHAQPLPRNQGANERVPSSESKGLSSNVQYSAPQNQLQSNTGSVSGTPTAAPSPPDQLSSLLKPPKQYAKAGVAIQPQLAPNNFVEVPKELDRRRIVPVPPGYPPLADAEDLGLMDYSGSAAQPAAAAAAAPVPEVAPAPPQAAAAAAPAAQPPPAPAAPPAAAATAEPPPPPPPPPPPVRRVDPSEPGDTHLDGVDGGYAFDVASLNTQRVPLTNAIGMALELGSSRAQKQQEDQLRRTRTVHALKSEIVCMHTVYNPLIAAFRSGGHQHAKQQALSSNDLAQVRRHHHMMQDRIRTYYQTTELKVVVIVDAASVPQLHGAGDVGGVGGGSGGMAYTVTKHGENRFNHVQRGSQQVMRGGINTKTIVSSRMPPSTRPANVPRAAKLPVFLHRDDHPHPSVRLPRDALRGIDVSRINLRAK